MRRAREAPGCLDVAITADSLDPARISPARINNDERWASAEHLDAWRAVAHAPDVGAEMLGVDVGLYDAADRRPPF